MVTVKLQKMLKPHSKSLISFIDKYSNIEFKHGGTLYLYSNDREKVIFQIDDIEADGNIAMSLLHEMSHFIQCKPERIKLPNFGFKGKGKSLAALKCEIETITISLILADHFGVKPTSYLGLIENLSSFEKFRNASVTSQQKWVGGIFMNAHYSNIENNKAIYNVYDLLDEFNNRVDSLKGY